MRKVALGLAAVLSLTVVYACGDESSEASTDSGDAPTDSDPGNSLADPAAPPSAPTADSGGAGGATGAGGSDSGSSEGGESSGEAEDQTTVESDAGTGNGPNCPGSEPENGSSCDSFAICRYDETGCACAPSGSWSCAELAPGEDPNPAPDPEPLPDQTGCPDPAPETDTECLEVGRICGYGAAGACSCERTEVWHCFGGVGGPEDCPAAKPAGACDTSGELCPYPDGACVCLQDEWRCL